MANQKKRPRNRRPAQRSAPPGGSGPTRGGRALPPPPQPAPVGSGGDGAPIDPEALSAGIGPVEAAPPPEPPASVTPPGTTRRRVERVSRGTPPRLRPGRGKSSTSATTFEPLDPEDASIPFDRVPYVPADLRRVAVMATFMVVLIVVADIIVSHVLPS